MDTNNRTNNPRSEEPIGDLGHGHKTWAPESGEQGISNRPDDEGNAVLEADEKTDDAAFNGDDDDDDEEVDDEDEIEENEDAREV